jgi:RimJ/RimL family protein N-acetyltransferase
VQNVAVTQTPLQTERIRLEPLIEEHFELEVELDSDPEVMRYLTGCARTREQVQHAHEMRLETARPVDGLGFWLGFVEDEFVGWWMLEPAGWAEGELVPGEVELGFRMLRRHWRKGLASEGAGEVMRHAFEDLGMNRLYTYTMAVNAGSQAVSRHIGLRYVRTFHDEDEVGPEGFEQGAVEYSITADEWRAAQAAG